MKYINFLKDVLGLCIQILRTGRVSTYEGIPQNRIKKEQTYFRTCEKWSNTISDASSS